MNFEVNAHDAPLSRLVFLRADGSTGTLDLHDDNALHDEDEVIKAKHLAAHAVTNGKIAPGAVTDNELAGHAVDRRHLSEELDTELANLKKSCDSISLKQIEVSGMSNGYGNDNILDLPESALLVGLRITSPPNTGGVPVNRNAFKLLNLADTTVVARAQTAYTGMAYYVSM